MKPVRGLPIRRSPRNSQKPNPSTPNGEKTSGWDRFNGKISPSEKESLRNRLKELNGDTSTNQISSFQQNEDYTERVKGIIRRLWIEVD